MSALNEYAKIIGDEYQQLDGVDSPVNMLPGSRQLNEHLLKNGDYLPGILAAYQIEGVPGVYDWFEHMAKDFTSPAGIPLPFADIIQQMTGLPAQQALDWLTANLTEAVEMGAEASIMAFFRRNPKAYSICLGLGVAFGLYNNNPMLVAMNGLLYFTKLRKEGRLNNSLWNNADRYLRTSLTMVDRVCTYTFITNTALMLTGGSLSNLAGQFVDALSWGGKVAKAAKLSAAAVCATDIVEGVANFGLSLLVGKVVNKIVAKANENVKEELAKLEPVVESRRQLLEMIHKQAPPETIAPLIELMNENGVYKPLLD